MVWINRLRCYTSYKSELIFVWLFFWPGPQDIPYVYCLFYVTFVPLRWIYYRFKKWHYYLLVRAASFVVFFPFSSLLFLSFEAVNAPFRQYVSRSSYCCMLENLRLPSIIKEVEKLEGDIESLNVIRVKETTAVFLMEGNGLVISELLCWSIFKSLGLYCWY